MRQATALNHSATHLLHAALRQVLGEHVTQKGSLVDSQRLRFDFSHFEAITSAQLKELEAIVNREVRGNTEVETLETDIETAKAKVLAALFGEKYGDQVRVLSMGGDFSVELCGGATTSSVQVTLACSRSSAKAVWRLACVESKRSPVQPRLPT